MSEMDKVDQGNASDVTPIVLVIGIKSQSYLKDNEVLQVLYGDRSPQRVSLPELETSRSDVVWELFYPYTDDKDRKLQLLELFDSVAASQLQSFLTSDEFYAAVYNYIRQATVLTENDVQRVRVIICDEGMLATDLPMISVAHRYFPDAVLFSAESDRAIPKRFIPEVVATAV